MHISCTNKEVYNGYLSISGSQPAEYSYAIPSDAGCGSINRHDLFEGIALRTFDMQYNYDMQFCGAYPNNNIDITFCLGEDILWQSFDTPTGNHYVQYGQAFLSCERSAADCIKYLKGYKYHFASISLQRFIFDRFADDKENFLKSSLPSFSLFGVTQSMSAALKQILDFSCNGITENMLRLGKTIELCAICFETALSTGINIPEIMQQDPLITQAKALINKDLCSPPSCSELAKLLYISESKLSRLFKSQLGITVHQYLYNQRMKAAQQMLVSGETHIGSVAAALGYANMSHFSYAFNRYYGMNPSKFIKSMK